MFIQSLCLNRVKENSVSINKNEESSESKSILQKKWCSNKKNGKDDNSDMLNIKLK